MGMFDSLYDERGQEWQTKAYECGLCRFSIGDTMPPVDGIGNTYQVEVLGDGPNRSFIDGFATVSDGTLVHIDERRDPGLPLLDYYGGLIHEARMTAHEPHCASCPFAGCHDCRYQPEEPK